MKLGSKICQFSMKIIKKEKLHSILICKNDTEKFYKRNKWKKFYKKNFETLDKELKKMILLCVLIRKKVCLEKLSSTLLINFRLKLFC